ncbi:GspH/FimT family protein [Lysobacter silvisoli]|nr:GspH/FimT family pseudopilin [Lysobacter silvisoli]
MNKRQRRGIGLALGLLAAGAAPAHAEAETVTLQRDRLQRAVQALGTDLAYARSAAIRRGTQVVLCPRASDGRCRPNGRWEQGWLVFVDRDGDGRPDGAGGLLRVSAPARAGLTIRSTVGEPVLRYGPGGRGAWQRLLICGGERLLGEMEVSADGRVRSARPKVQRPCPAP